MNIYTIELRNEPGVRYDLIRFCEANKVSVFMSYQLEDVFTDKICCDLLVPTEANAKFKEKYSTKIKSMEAL